MRFQKRRPFLLSPFKCVADHIENRAERQNYRAEAEAQDCQNNLDVANRAVNGESSKAVEKRGQKRQK